MSKRPYSTFRKVGNFVFVSGQTGFNPDTRTIGETVEEQTEQTLKNVKAALEEAGSSMNDVVKCSVFLKDTTDFKSMNGVYVTFFGDVPPARTTVGAPLVSPKMLVEIDAIAYIGT
ncbi:MAG: RidA family protein [Candidatus Bathyarchaeota archaeon]|nr:RidA family protein [Candidatus Bathyarchaeota archaeon]